MKNQLHVYPFNKQSKNEMMKTTPLVTALKKNEILRNKFKCILFYLFIYSIKFILFPKKCKTYAQKTTKHF